MAFAGTLETVKERGKLECGVNEGLLGFAMPDAVRQVDGIRRRLLPGDLGGDLRRPDKVDYVPVATKDRFDVLKSGKIDVLSRNSTWTMSRETDLGLTFVDVTYYDGQGFMVPRAKNITSALELGNSKVCVLGGTTTEANLADYFGANNMTYEAVTTASGAESLADYKDGKCGVLTSDMSQLYAQRLELPDAGDHIILPDAISKEPLGPAVRQDDPKWATLVKWVGFALLNADELGVGMDTIDEAMNSKKPDVRRLVGLDGNFGEQMGLSNDWAAKMIRLVGNYGDIYDRNLGTDSKLGIPRGMNQLWSRGGIQYAPPIR